MFQKKKKSCKTLHEIKENAEFQEGENSVIIKFNIYSFSTSFLASKKLFCLINFYKHVPHICSTLTQVPRSRHYFQLFTNMNSLHLHNNPMRYMNCIMPILQKRKLRPWEATCPKLEFKPRRLSSMFTYYTALCCFNWSLNFLTISDAFIHY